MSNFSRKNLVFCIKNRTNYTKSFLCPNDITYVIYTIGRLFYSDMSRYSHSLMFTFTQLSACMNDTNRLRPQEQHDHTCSWYFS